MDKKQYALGNKCVLMNLKLELVRTVLELLKNMNFPQKTKVPKHQCLSTFQRVAGAGFEPTTFGL
jgi:hypothetical protein